MKGGLYNYLVNESCGGGRKRIFIGLFSISCFFLCLAIVILLVLPWLGFAQNYFRYISISLAFLLIILLIWLGLFLVFHIYTAKNFPGIHTIRHVIIRLMLPLMEIAGNIFGINKEIVRRSFIKVNNEYVINNCKNIAFNKILLLLPHCIQSSKCSRRLTYSIVNCRKCGNCQIGELIDLSLKYGFKIAIATGGTIARRIVIECKPEFIVAIACERDLTSGIQDTFPLPVFGILNSRPNGPCRDTLLQMDLLNKLLIYIKENKYSPPSQSSSSSTVQD